MMDDTKNLLVWAKEKDNKYVSKTLKYTLLAFSFIFWIVGALFAAVGGWTISQKANYTELSYFAIVPGSILAALGCFIFVVSTFGVLGAYRENMSYLRIYKLSLVLVLLCEVCAGLVGFAFWPEVKKIVDNNLSRAIRRYTVDSDLRSMIDLIQRQLECCGSLTIDDWDSNPYFTCRKKGSYRSCGVPWTCCFRKFERNRQCGYGIRRKRTVKKIESRIYTIGCLDKAFEFMKNNMVMIGGLAIACTLPLLIGIYMVNRFGKQIERQIDAFNKANEKFQFTRDSDFPVEPRLDTSY